jgi:hypothetical protein
VVGAFGAFGDLTALDLEATSLLGVAALVTRLAESIGAGRRDTVDVAKTGKVSAQLGRRRRAGQRGNVG